MPSLEVLPLFEGGLHPHEPKKTGFRYKAHSSYGSIARGMLTGELAGGILHWEVFISEVLALPGQRALWTMPLFLHACPTEILFRESLFKILYPSQKSSPSKLPNRLIFGVESRNSLTQSQVQAWLSRWTTHSKIQLVFKVLPMDLMLQGIKAEMLDGIIVPAPWGMQAEAMGVGKVDPQFAPGNLAQKVVMVCRRDTFEKPVSTLEDIATDLTAARIRLRTPAVLRKAADEMARHGKPLISAQLLERSAKRHFTCDSPYEITPDTDHVVHELKRLENLSALPPQVAPNEQTARLLLC